MVLAARIPENAPPPAADPMAAAPKPLVDGEPKANPPPAAVAKPPLPGLLPKPLPKVGPAVAEPPRLLSATAGPLDALPKPLWPNPEKPGDEPVLAPPKIVPLLPGPPLLPAGAFDPRVLGDPKEGEAFAAPNGDDPAPNAGDVPEPNFGAEPAPKEEPNGLAPLPNDGDTLAGGALEPREPVEPKVAGEVAAPNAGAPPPNAREPPPKDGGVVATEEPKAGLAAPNEAPAPNAPWAGA